MDTGTATGGLERAVFEDALGQRHYAGAPGGHAFEVLELREDFSTSAFEAALRERVAAVAGFHSSCFSRVRGVQRANQSGAELFVVSDRVAGARLSTVLAAARPPRTPLEPNATLCLIRQLVAAIALLHEKLPTLAHAALSPERIIITPTARLVVADYVLAAALEQLRYSPERYWKELGILLPLPRAGHPQFDQRADVMQIGAIALELIQGRAIEHDEYPERINELTERAWDESAAAGTPLPVELRTWLHRMLQLDAPQAFASAVDAWIDLERVLGATGDGASFHALESLMAEYARTITAAPAAAVASIPAVAAASAVPAPAPAAAVSEPATAPVAPVTQPRPVPAATVGASATDRSVTVQSASTDVPPFEDPTVNRTTPGGRGRWLAVAAIVLLVSAGAMVGRQYLLPSAAAEAPGTLVVNTNPPGFQVFIDGQPRGVTPLTVELAAGAHELKIATEGEPRIIPLTLTAGSTVAQTIEVPKAAPITGELMVRTDPPGATVTVDGMARGTTPLTIEHLTPGPHSITLATELSSVTQEVTIEPGTTASLVVPMTAPEGVPVSGWIAVSAPAEVHLYEDGRLLGSSQSERIMVSAGRHTLQIVNEALGFRATQVVMVSPGKVSTIQPAWPQGSMALNAQPWAEVWMNGQKVGETPIGNVAVPLGTHEVVFRHPELGEQTVRATVTAQTPARVSVDMRKR